ncbi:lamin tail domain-containing protein [Streptomyces sp. NPDC006368]|uniref:lamin tail domain-containing protein n=1 Tax=Streptomyces sp. NPDC006368 TaxID=3156760 RepID=UPI00339F0637
MPTPKVTIREILVAPQGDVTKEVVQLHNRGNAEVDLTGWRLLDTGRHVAAPFDFRFPERTLRPDDDVFVHTGDGEDHGPDLFWGLHHAVWNNSGDTARLLDASGHEVDRLQWTKKPRDGRVVGRSDITADIADFAAGLQGYVHPGELQDSLFDGHQYFWQEFSGGDCAIVHSGREPEGSPPVIHEIASPLYVKYKDVGGLRMIGPPLTGKRKVPDRQAFFTDFPECSIYFSEETGTRLIGAAFRDKWRSPETGGHSGPLGLPLTDERREPGLQYVDFENGTIWKTGNSIRAIQDIRIDYVGFHCFGEDEDLAEGASDEVYFIVEAEPLQRPEHPNQLNDSKWVTMLPAGSTAYENVDAGETFSSDPTTVFWGRPGPLRLRVTGFEHDFGDPNALRDEIATAVAAVGAAAALTFPVASAIFLSPQIQSAVTNTINTVIDSGDDIIQVGTWEIPSRRALLNIIDGPLHSEFGLGWHQRIMLNNDGSPQDQIYFRIVVTE